MWQVKPIRSIGQHTTLSLPWPFCSAAALPGLLWNSFLPGLRARSDNASLSFSSLGFPNTPHSPLPPLQHPKKSQDRNPLECALCLLLEWHPEHARCEGPERWHLHSNSMGSLPQLLNCPNGTKSARDNTQANECGCKPSVRKAGGSSNFIQGPTCSCEGEPCLIHPPPLPLEAQEKVQTTAPLQCAAKVTSTFLSLCSKLCDKSLTLS